MTEGASFCAYCGAPQLYVAEEDTPAAAAEDALQAAAARASKPGMVDWTVALRAVCLVGALGLAMFVGSEWLRLLGILSFMLVLSAGQLATNLYLRWRPQARMDGRVGLRIGLLTGVVLAACIVASTATAELTDRYLLHQGAVMDAQYVQSMHDGAQMMEKITGKPLTPEQAGLISSPEYRAGSVLAGVFAEGILVLTATMVGGALAGFLNKRRRAAA